MFVHVTQISKYVCQLLVVYTKKKLKNIASDYYFSWQLITDNYCYI